VPFGKTVPIVVAITFLVAVPAATIDGQTSGVTFVDVAQAAGINFRHTYSPEKRYIVESMSGGVALLDYDNDGYLDIYFVNSTTTTTVSTTST
jgi:hypothetical protein